jgi:hypothetical protein
VGETVVLNEEVVLTAVLCSKVVTVIRKEAPYGFLVNFYVFAGHDIQVPHSCRKDDVFGGKVEWEAGRGPCVLGF